MKKRGARTGLISLTLLMQSAMPVYAADNAATAAVAAPPKAAPFLIAGAVLLTVILLALILFIRGGRRKGEAGKHRPELLLQAEIYTGSFRNEGELCITDRLSVGSGEDCDLRFAPEDMAPFAAELILKEGKLLLTGRGEEVFVAVGGRKVQDQAEVRSGDVLSVGEAEFSLRFPV